MGVDGRYSHGNTGYSHPETGAGETWTTQNPEHVCLSGGTVVTLRHLAPDEDASGPFNFLLTNARALSALGSTRLLLIPVRSPVFVFVIVTCSAQGILWNWSWLTSV